MCTVLQLNFYDVYKELFLRSIRVGTVGESQGSAEVAKINSEPVVRNAPWYTRLSMDFYADYLSRQESITRRSNPAGYRLLRGSWVVTEKSAALYRRQNRGPMRFWISVSLCPHSYLFAMAGMCDLLHLYLVARLTLFNGLALVGLMLQRRSSKRTVEAYEAEGWTRHSLPLRAASALS